MANKINYANKAPFQTREDIPDENKVNAEDMNEIKTAVNNNVDELDTAKEDIESLQDEQGTASTDITSLKNRTTALETDNTTNKQNIQNLQTENETNKSDIEELQTDNETNKTNISNLETNKVDKEVGKGLSTEDFTTELKTKLEGLENYNDTEIKADIEEVKNDLNNKVDKVEGKNLSTNDFTNEYKEKLDTLNNYDDTQIKTDITELQGKVTTLEEDNTTNKTNIEALQEDNTQNKQDIENLQESQVSQNSDIEALMNALPSETAEGETVNIKGTIPVKFKEFSVKGNNKQEENVNLDYTIEDAIIVGGPALSNSDLGKTAIVKTKPNTTYTISRNIKTSRFKIAESEKEWDGSNTFALQNQIDPAELSADYTTSETGNYLYIFYWYESGGDTTVPEITVTTQFTPDYPSPVKCVGSNVNRFNMTNLENGGYYSGIVGDVLSKNSNNTRIRLNELISVKSNTQYSFSINTEKTLRYNILEVGTDNIIKKVTSITNTNSTTFTTTEETAFITFLLMWQTTTQNITTEDLQDCLIKLEEGDTATSYSPYNCGNVNITKCNKNLAKIDTVNKTTVRNGVTVTIDEDGTITLNGTATVNFYLNMIDITDYSSVNMKNYTLPQKGFKAYFELLEKNNSKLSENNGDISFYIRNFAASSTGETAVTYAQFLRIIQGDVGATVKDMQINQNRVVSYMYISSGVVLDNLKFRFAIYSEDETDTSYARHEEENYILPIQRGMLEGDYFVKEADGWKEVHLRDKRSIKDDITNAYLSGTNNFIYVSNLLQNIAQLPSANSEDVNVISNIAQHSSYDNMYDKLIDYGIGISNVGSLIIRNKDCTTLGEYKEVLNNDSFYYYFYLAEPTKLPCTEEQSTILEQLSNSRAFEGETNIYSVDEISPIFKVTAVKDINSVITQLNQLILEGGN